MASEVGIQAGYLVMKWQHTKSSDTRVDFTALDSRSAPYANARLTLSDPVAARLCGGNHKLSTQMRVCPWEGEILDRAEKVMAISVV